MARWLICLIVEKSKQQIRIPFPIQTHAISFNFDPVNLDENALVIWFQKV